MVERGMIYIHPRASKKTKGGVRGALLLESILINLIDFCVHIMLNVLFYSKWSAEGRNMG